MNFKAFGMSLGGQDVESGEFQLPARICNGCLVDFSTGNDPTSTPVQPNCLKRSTTAAANTMSPVHPGTGRGRDAASRASATRKACDPAHALTATHAACTRARNAVAHEVTAFFVLCDNRFAMTRAERGPSQGTGRRRRRVHLLAVRR